MTRPPNHLLEDAYRWCTEWWSAVLDGVEPIARAAAHPYIIPDLRKARSTSALLMRPIMHVALFHGLAQATNAGVALGDAVKALNHIQWSAEVEQWRDVIVRANGSMITKANAIELAGRVIGYQLAGHRLPGPVIDRLRMAYAEAKGWDPTGTAAMPTLPEPVL